MTAAAEIRERVSMTDICSKYGIAVDNKGFALCPFHPEKTASCRFYPDHYYCFGCGSHGDAITFIINYFNISYNEAILKLKTDFALVASEDVTKDYRHRIMAKRAVFDRNRRMREIERTRAEIDKAFFDALDDLERLRDVIKRNRPRSPDEHPNETFIRALNLLDFAEGEVERTDERRRAYADECDIYDPGVYAG